jgi:hypothetical protein
MTRGVISAQPGWFFVTDGSDGLLYEEEIIGWQVHGGSTLPITVPYGIASYDHDWAVRSPNGTYWIPETGVFKTKEEVLERLVSMRKQRRAARRLDNG